MKKTFKKALSCILAAIMAASVMATFVSAKNYIKISANGYYNDYVTCTLSNKKKNATIWVDCYNTVCSANDIKMTTTSGRYIWSQTRAIAFSGRRSFNLGCDNSAYRIYLKIN